MASFGAFGQATPAEAGPSAAIVVFINSPATRSLRILRPGFRHCFAAIYQAPGIWLVCDPLKDRIELTALHLNDGFDLAAHYRAAGHRVLVGTTIPRMTMRLPPVPGPLTCVAVVKRLVGLRAAAVMTPYQLYRRLVALHWQTPDAHELGAKSLDIAPLKEY